MCDCEHQSSARGPHPTQGEREALYIRTGLSPYPFVEAPREVARDAGLLGAMEEQRQVLSSLEDVIDRLTVRLEVITLPFVNNDREAMTTSSPTVSQGSSIRDAVLRNNAMILSAVRNLHGLVDAVDI